MMSEPLTVKTFGKYFSYVKFKRESEISDEKLARMNPKERRRFLEAKVYRRHKELSPSSKKVKKSFFGSTPPTIFVGRTGYPKVSAGILSPVDFREDAGKFDSPNRWYNENQSIDRIIGYRSNLVNSREKVDVKGSDKFSSYAKEIAMAKKPVDLEVDLKKKPKFQLNFSMGSAPFGPSGNLEKVELTGNPSTSRAVEKVVSDDEWNAESAAKYLYEKDLDYYGIQRVLSAGLLGKKENRRMVPTRWSITAVDDMVSKQVRDRVKDYQELGETRYFYNSYNGNHFHIILTPGKWEYELLEIKGAGSVWNPGSKAFVNKNYENFGGRTNYAKETAGAYYATRLGVCEYLEKIGRQAKVLVVREVTDMYWAPLGVWVIRETVKDAFDDYSVMESFRKGFEKVLKNVSVDGSLVKQNSKMMSSTQHSLSAFK